MSTRLKTDHCPVCSKTLDACTGVCDDATPEPGDITICFYCGSVLKFSNDMSLVKASKHDLSELPSDTYNEILLVQRHIKNQNEGN